MSPPAKQLCGLAAPLTLINGNWKHLAPWALSRGAWRAPSAGGCQHHSLGGALGRGRRLPPRGRADLGRPASRRGDSSPRQSLHHHPGASGSNPSWEFQLVLIPRAAAKGGRAIPCFLILSPATFCCCFSPDVGGRPVPTRSAKLLEGIHFWSRSSISQQRQVQPDAPGNHQRLMLVDANLRPQWCP